MGGNLTATNGTGFFKGVSIEGDLFVTQVNASGGLGTAGSLSAANGNFSGDVQIVGGSLNAISSGNGFFAGNLGVGGELSATDIISQTLRVSGTKNAVIDTPSYGRRLTYADESAEVYFFDRGQGQLVNGQATIELDPIFLETVTIDARHPMLVQVTLTADCRGIFVEPGTRSFTVRELQGGRSNATFSWEVCRRAKPEASSFCISETEGEIAVTARARSPSTRLAIKAR